MSLCRMDRQSETVRFLDDLDIALAMDNREDGGRKASSIELTVQAINLRVSYRDILLVQTIANRALELSSQASKPAEKAPELNLAAPATLAPTPIGNATNSTTQIVVARENVRAATMLLCSKLTASLASS